jgi:hypothetical protein
MTKMTNGKNVQPNLVPQNLLILLDVRLMLQGNSKSMKVSISRAQEKFFFEMKIKNG